VTDQHFPGRAAESTSNRGEDSDEILAGGNEVPRRFSVSRTLAMEVEDLPEGGTCHVHFI
jgi:hypothetical protein